MELNLDLGLVAGQFDESNVGLDEDLNVHGVLTLSGVVDEEWSAAFEAAGPPDAPWSLEAETSNVRFGPIPVREFQGCVVSLRNQINAANDSVTAERHRRARAAYIDAEERAQAHRQVMEALSGVFGRRLSPVDGDELQAA
jgi:hypothetical protein